MYRIGHIMEMGGFSQALRWALSRLNSPVSPVVGHFSTQVTVLV